MHSAPGHPTEEFLIPGFLEIPAAFLTGLAVGLVSALAGIGGGVLIVPMLYLVYSHTSVGLSGQTVAAHATSLCAGMVAALLGIRRYHHAAAIAWPFALWYGVPGAVSAFLTARIVTRLSEAGWVRTAFGIFLLIAALDMIRKAVSHRDLPAAEEAARAAVPGPGRRAALALIGVGGGAVSALLGIGGGLLAVPAFFYIARLPVRTVAPTSLVAVGLATMAGTAGYVSAGPGPEVSGLMAGFVDLRMAIPLALGAALTVPLGVRLNRGFHPTTLYWIFAALLGVLGARLAWQGLGWG